MAAKSPFIEKEAISEPSRSASTSTAIFPSKGLAFHNLQDDQKKQILDYKLMIYLCSGTDSEKLDWSRTINIAGEETHRSGIA